MRIPDPKAVLEGRAISTATTATDAQLLTNEEAMQFVELVVELGGMVQDARIIQVRGPGQEISDMDISDGHMAGGLGELETVSSSDELETVYASRTLEPKAFDLSYKYSDRMAQMNIEEDAHESHVDRVVRMYINNEINRIALQSDTGSTNPSGYASGNMTTIDGWMKEADNGHVYDHAGGYVNPEVFKQMWMAEPFKWRSSPARKADLRFYVNDDVVIEYRDYLSRFTTPLGSLALTQENQITFAGILLQENSYITNDATGVLTQSSSSSSFTEVLLVERRNLLFGWGPEIKLHTAVDPTSGKWTYYYWCGYFDVQYERPDAVVKGVNILPTVNASLAVAY